jgi:TctA family transporter
MALMMGAMMIQGIQPGPSMIGEQPSLFWGLIVSMWVGNLFLLLLNLPLVGVWARMVTIPYHYLYPGILLFCVIGAFSLNNDTFDIYLMAGFGVFGYVLRKLSCEMAPLLLGFILGPMMEEYLSRSLLLSQNDFSVFISRPLSLGMLLLAVALLVVVLAPSIRRKRETTFKEAD